MSEAPGPETSAEDLALRERSQDLTRAYEIDGLETLLNALPIPARSAQKNCWIAVTARFDWSSSGERFVETHAYAYTTRAVLVDVADPRRSPLVRGAWLTPSDVTRR